MMVCFGLEVAGGMSGHDTKTSVVDSSTNIVTEINHANFRYQSIVHLSHDLETEIVIKCIYFVYIFQTINILANRSNKMIFSKW